MHCDIIYTNFAKNVYMHSHIQSYGDRIPVKLMKYD
jgi:hypothetical protein